MLDDIKLTFNDIHMLQSSSLFQKRFFAQFYVLLILGGLRISRLLSDYLSFGWPNIVKTVNHWESFPKWKRPFFKSYENFLTVVNGNLIPAKLQFFSFIAILFKPFLLKYQSQKPMLPSLHGDLLKLVKKVLLLIIKSNLAYVSPTATELKKIKLINKDNFLKAKEIRRSTLGLVQENLLLI